MLRTRLRKGALFSIALLCLALLASLLGQSVPAQANFSNDSVYLYVTADPNHPGYNPNKVMCLNAHNHYNFGSINAAFCDAPDPDQSWELAGDNLGVDVFLLKLKGTNLCLNAHYRTDYSLVNVANCNSSDPDQRWSSENEDHFGELYLTATRDTHRMCLNAHYRYNFSPINLASCDAPDDDQNWQIP